MKARKTGSRIDMIIRENDEFPIERWIVAFEIRLFCQAAYGRCVCSVGIGQHQNRMLFHIDGNPGNIASRGLQCFGQPAYITVRENIERCLRQSVVFHERADCYRTVGYGDISPATIPGRLAISALMYIGGIAYMAQAASQYFEYRLHKRDSILNGKWKWNMNDHIVFLNSPRRNPQLYFSRLMSEFRRSALPAAQKPVRIVCPHLNDGLNDELRMLNLAHVNHEVSSAEGFENSCLDKASTIVVLSHDGDDPNADSITFDLVARAREANPHAKIFAEAALDRNKNRLKAVGADHVIRSIREYPEFLARTILTPGTEYLVVDIFDSDGQECVRYDEPVTGRWADIQCRFILADIGTPIAYLDQNSRVVTGAHPDTDVTAKAVLVIVREGNILAPEQVHKKLNNTLSFLAVQNFGKSGPV